MNAIDKLTELSKARYDYVLKAKELGLSPVEAHMVVDNAPDLTVRRTIGGFILSIRGTDSVWRIEPEGDSTWTARRFRGASLLPGKELSSSDFKELVTKIDHEEAGRARW